MGLPTLAGFAGYQSFSHSSETTDPYKDATMLFAQTSAPTGWTKSTTDTDTIFRITSGSVTTGGSATFTTMNTSTTITGTATVSGTALGGTTLSSPQLPNHSHSAPTYSRVGNQAPTTLSGAGYYWNPAITTGAAVGVSPTAGWSGGPHSHTVTSGSTGPTSSPFAMAVRYVDAILATKD